MQVYDFGYRLKELRENKGLSQNEVAKRLKLSRTTISAYEANIQTPKIDNLIKLALLYNSSTDYILGLNKNSYLMFDGITEDEQKTILDIVDMLLTQFNKKKD